MEYLLGFTEPPPSDNDVVEGKTQQSFKLVPWMNWDEWNFVHDSLFSDSSTSVSSAIQRIATWRSRGCTPVAVEVTASIIEIQQKDPFFRNDLPENSVQSEEILAMLYCMAIMRLVNGVVEKTRKKHEISIAEAADAIGLPRMLIDVRHEGSHRDLPSLQLVRLASTKALDWLKSYYWDPQRISIPIQSDVTANLRKEIKQKLLDLASCLKERKITRSNKQKGTKKHVTKAMKNVLRLFSSFTSEVASVILEILMNALDSSDLIEIMNSSEQKSNNMNVLFTDLKDLILKLSNKEPDLLLTLLRAVLEKYETQENGEEREKVHISQLSCLLKSLIEILGKLKEFSNNVSFNTTLNEVLSKCLLACSNGDDELMTSAILLARIMKRNNLTHKLNKLLSLKSVKDLDNSRFILAKHTSSESFFTQQEDFIQQGLKNLEKIKVRGKNCNNSEVKSKWSVVKKWVPCPIGMLSHSVGSWGKASILDFNGEEKEIEKVIEKEKEEVFEVLIEEKVEKKGICGKRVAESVLERCVKKIKESKEKCEGDFKGYLMIDGLWKKVKEEELYAISSGIRILV